MPPTASTSNYIPTLLPNTNFVKIKRAGKACEFCKKSKSRCDNSLESSTSCRRCRESGVECVFRGVPKSIHDSSTSTSSTSTNRTNGNTASSSKNGNGNNSGSNNRMPPRNAIPHPSQYETRLELVEKELEIIKNLLNSSLHPQLINNGNTSTTSSNISELLYDSRNGGDMKMEDDFRNSTTSSSSSSNAIASGSNSGPYLTPSSQTSNTLESSMNLLPSTTSTHQQPISLSDPSIDLIARQCFSEFIQFCTPYAPFISPETDTYDLLLLRSPLLLYCILAITSRFQENHSFTEHCESTGLNYLRNTLYSNELPTSDDLKGAIIWNSWLGKSCSPSLAVGLALGLNTPGCLVKLLKVIGEGGREECNTAFEENMPEVRTWLSLYSQDLWLSLASGRRSMVAVDFSIASTRLLLKFPSLRAIDSRLIAQAEIVTILAGVQKSFSRSQLHTVEETVSIITSADTALSIWESTWAEWASHEDETTSKFMTSSFRMQSAVGKFYLNTLCLKNIVKLEDINERNLPCLKVSIIAALEVVNCLKIYGSKRVKYAIEFVYVSAASCCLFLLKMIKLLPSAVDIQTTLLAIHETSQILKSSPTKQANYAVLAALNHLESQLSPNSMSFMLDQLPTSGLDPFVFDSNGAGGQSSSHVGLNGQELLSSSFFDPELELALSSVVENDEFWSWEQSLPADSFNAVLS